MESDAPTNQAGTATTLTVDPQQSRFGFKAKAFLLIPTSGRLTARSGSITIEGDTLRAEGIADAASVSTRLKPRDAHLRHKHYLFAKQHPDIKLVVPSMALDAKTAWAQLTARGETVDVDLDIESCELSSGVLRVKATGKFDRVPLGMLPPLAGVSRQIQLDLELVAR